AGRTGSIDIWWKTPSECRREVTSADHCELEIVNGSETWQKNEVDYFPAWIRESSLALINPISDIEKPIKDADDAELKQPMRNTHFAWMIMRYNGTKEKGLSASVAITDKTGLLFYCGGAGWGALYEDYRSFHDRAVARIVKHGSPEVTATITVLEDLSSTP